MRDRKRIAHEEGDDITYEFCIIPNVGFLGNEDLLVKDTELKLSFDLTKPEVFLIGDTPDSEPDIEIKDCYAITEYVSAPNMRLYYDSIDFAPIRYEIEDCEVFTKSIDQKETNIRFDNLRGGNIPSNVFVGIIETDALNGDYTKSCTRFECHGVTEMNITLNGNSVNGYPVRIKNAIPVQPLEKFIDCTNRTCNIYAGKALTPHEFDVNWIWAHCFESEETAQGWIGINFKLDTAFTKPMTMVVWIINPSVIAIDKFHQIEKINL